MQVYEIEPTVLRGLQTEIVCPRDQQQGSAYVDALSGTDQVGLAEFMLSYTWGYQARLHTVFSSVSTPDRSLVDDIQVNDIVDSLVLMCQERKLNPKRTYVKTNARRTKDQRAWLQVWICCLCMNQHRVKQKQAAGETVPFSEFEKVSVKSLAFLNLSLKLTHTVQAFGETVNGVGEILALMSPWRKPGYLTRVWWC